MYRAWRRSPTAAEPTVFCIRDGELLCGGIEAIHLARREAEVLQILIPHLGHFVSWQEIARQLLAVTAETTDEAALVRVYVSRLARKIDRKCSFGIEGKPGYGYRLFGRILTDPPAAGAAASP